MSTTVGGGRVMFLDGGLEGTSRPGGMFERVGGRRKRLVGTSAFAEKKGFFFPSMRMEMKER